MWHVRPDTTPASPISAPRCIEGKTEHPWEMGSGWGSQGCSPKPNHLWSKMHLQGKDCASRWGLTVGAGTTCRNKDPLFVQMSLGNKTLGREKQDALTASPLSSPLSFLQGTSGW